MGCGASKATQVEDGQASHRPCRPDTPQKVEKLVSHEVVEGPKVVVNRALPRNMHFEAIKKARPRHARAPHHKVIHLYICSTWNDTVGERHSLVYNVIPEINRALFLKGISVIPVDIDWEQSRYSAADRVRHLIRAVDFCRDGKENLPWFILLKGEKFGSLVEALPNPVETKSVCSESLAWLDALSKETTLRPISLQTIAALHAFLAIPPGAPIKRPHAFCYARSSDFIQHVKEQLQWVYDFEYLSPTKEVEGPSSFQYAKYDDFELMMSQHELADSEIRVSTACRRAQYSCSPGEPPEIISERIIQDEAGYPVGKVCQAEGRVAGLTPFETKVFQDLLQAVVSEFPYRFGPNRTLKGATKEALRQEYVMASASSLDETEVSSYILSDSPLGKTIRYCDPSEDRKKPMLLFGGRGSGVSSILGSVDHELGQERRKALHHEQKRLREPQRPMSARSDVSARSALSEASDASAGTLKPSPSNLDLSMHSREHVGPEGQIINVLSVLPQTFDRTVKVDDITDALRRMCLTVVSMFDLTTYVPRDYDDLCALWPELLGRAGQFADLVVLIDQVDSISALELSSQEKAIDLLAWIPEVLPLNVSMVLGYSGDDGDKLFQRLRPRCDVVHVADRSPADWELVCLKWEHRVLSGLSDEDRAVAQATKTPLYIALACVYRRVTTPTRKPKSGALAIAQSAQPTKLPANVESLVQAIFDELESQHGSNLVALVVSLLACDTPLTEQALFSIISHQTAKVNYTRRMVDVYPLLWLDLQGLVQQRTDAIVEFNSRAVLRLARDRYLTPCPKGCVKYTRDGICQHRDDKCEGWSHKEGKMHLLIQKYDIQNGDEHRARPAFVHTSQIDNFVKNVIGEQGVMQSSLTVSRS
eukprot:TRINITY_DN2018_c0_g1_i2.p1 TRINITY_DN2018_c0_g1~~TRINITY_DN2018_c0_g1_i2.p1  ORF type:complete len:878 (+),score=34.68 TRINITY_DN2018_c0_g1_i2:367-3000(+)